MTLRLGVLLVFALFHVDVLAEYRTNYADVDVSRWKCLLCEFKTYAGTTGQLSIASVLTTDDSDRFGRNGSFEQAGTRSVLDTRMGVNRENGWLFSANARNIGLDSNDIAFDIKNRGSLEATVRFQQYRRLTESSALTPFHQDDGRLTLSSAWQRDSQTHGFESLGSTNRHVELATTRRVLDSMLSVEVIPRIKLSLGHRSATKDGIRETFRDGIFQSTALPKPVDHETVTNRVQISYRHQRLSAVWSRTRSSFENFEPSLHWESPYSFGLSANESANASSHEHNNDTFDVRLYLPRNGMLRFHERRGQTETQSQSLSYGLGSLIGDIEPVQLFAKRNYRSRRMVMTTAIREDLEVSASRLLYDLKDLRPVEELTPALGGSFLTRPQAVRSGNFSRRCTELGLSYRPDSGRGVQSRFWVSSLERTDQEITENDTQGLEVKLSQPISERWEAFTTLSVELRDASAFQSITTNNPYTRRFHQAELRRRAWSSGIRYAARQKSDFISLGADVERQDYPASALGLSGKEIRGYTLGYGLRIGKRIAADGHIGSYRQFTEINGAQSLALSNPWAYASNDSVNSAGLRLSIKPVNKIVDNILVEYALSNGFVKQETLFDGSSSFFPDQIARQESVDLSVGFAEIFGTTIGARVYVERYDAKDWSIDNVFQSTLANVLTLGRDRPSYSNTLFSLELIRRL